MVAASSPPTLTKTFGASSVQLNSSTSLTFKVENTNLSDTTSNIAFTDDLPDGLVVSDPNGVTGDCGGSSVITATAGSSRISLSGGSVAAGSSCTFSVSVTGTKVGPKTNTTSKVSSSFGTDGNAATATIEVIGPPELTKGFSPTAVALNTSSVLTFTIKNPNTVTSLHGLFFDDALPSGMEVANPAVASTSCGGTVAGSPGSTQVGLSHGSVDASATCTVSITVIGTTPGPKTNTVSVSSTEAGFSTEASATLQILSPPTMTKSFSPAEIAINGESTLNLTVTNPASNPIALTGVGFTDSLPSPVQIASSFLDGPHNCGGGTLTTPEPGSQLFL